MNLWMRCLCWFGLFVLLPAPGLLAQSYASGVKPPPRLAYVYPAGAQQGTTVTVSLGGQNLVDATLARFSGPGLSARLVDYERPLSQKELVDLRERVDQLKKKRTEAKETFTPEDEKNLAEIQAMMARRNNRQASPGLAETVTLTITVAADAPPGTRELRLQTATGLSNPLVFDVGTLPEISAPVITPTTAGANKGNRNTQQPASSPATVLNVTLPTLVNGQILAGEIDRLKFSAKKGQQLTVMLSARSLIPYLADAVPGWFQATLSLRDAQGRELAYDDDFQFRPDPVLLATIPADGDYVVEIKDAIYRGREDFVYRVALGELPFVQSVFPLGTHRGNAVTVAVTGWNLDRTTLPVDPRDSAPGLFLLAVNDGVHSSNPIRFTVGQGPELIESEPNDTAAAVNTPITIPHTVNGRIEHPKDRDVYCFEARAGDAIVAEITARRLDSPLDSNLQLTDAAGHPLASNDDYDDKSEGLLTHQADSRIQFTLPTDGRYYLTVTDTQHRGGPEYAYRLAINAPQPNFSLRVTPSAVNVPLGATVPITVYALRHDGFKGEIKLALGSNPDGFRLSGARIPAGQDAITLTLTAPNTARQATLHLLGQAVINGRSVVREAVSADDTMQAFLYRHLVTARSWEVSVTGRSAALRLFDQAPLRLKAGTPQKITVTTPGLPRAIDDLKVELLNPPPGLSIVSSSASEGQLSCKLLYEPVPTKPLTAGNLILTVSGKRPNTKGKAASGVVQLGTAPAIAFEIISP